MEDCLLHILIRLPIEDIHSFGLANKENKKVSLNSILWHNLLKRDLHPEYKFQEDNYETYKLDIQEMTLMEAFRLRKLTSEFYNLSGLCFPRFGIQILSTGINRLTNLKELNLKKNNIKSIPWQIGSLTNLQELCLSNNQLTSLPSEIGKLTKLYNLSICNNYLESVPQEITKLLNLDTLHLSGNRLKSLPNEIDGLANLRVFSYCKNPIECLNKN